jgi:hypothetical protein
VLFVLLGTNSVLGRGVLPPGVCYLGAPHPPTEVA